MCNAEYNFFLTAIQNLTINQPVRAEGTYTLSGQKVENNASLRKGIYIRGGKKIVVK